MTETPEEFANLQQLYGELYQYSDHKRGEHVSYVAYDGQIRSGTIVWVQPPGQSVGKTGNTYQLRGQYIVSPDQDTGMPDFVPFGQVQTAR